jgi:hypothetical protein
MYEIVTRQVYSRKKLALVTLREIEPVTHEVLKESARPPVGTTLRDQLGNLWKVKSHVGAAVALSGPSDLPSGNYFETGK